ncbi:MAG: efflux RND transporter periplasmic adaptor subunit [Myxococcota bacterium]
MHRVARGLWTLPLALCCLGGCASDAPAATEPPPPPVHAADLTFTQVVPKSTSTAEILASRQSDMRAETTGRVVAVYADAGDRVTEGDLLVRLDVGRTTSAVKAAQAAVAQSDARSQQAERELQRTERLVASGGLPEQRLDDARDEVRMSRAARDAALAEAKLARRGLTEAVVRAPFGGTVVERPIEVGEWASPGSELLTLADTSLLKARVLLDPREALDVAVGSAVTATVFARPGEEFTGRVVRVGEVINPQTRRLPVEIELDDPDRRLRPGLVARFTVETGEPRRALRVPPEAVFERFGRQHVYIIDDGIAYRREVALGPMSPDAVEITSGVREGETVVTKGISRVVDASKVLVVPEPDGETPARGEAPEPKTDEAP